MIWQDVMIGIANIVFIYAMLPQLFYGFKTRKGLISIQFSTLNILAMSGLAIVYISFKLYISVTLTMVLIILWLILLFQRISYGKVKDQQP